MSTTTAQQNPALEQSTPRPWLVLLEVTIVTLLLPVLGMWRNAHDPFFLQSSFPWVALAPLIISLRYGFAHGLGSAVVLNLLMYASFRQHHPAMASFPGGLALGILLVAMLAGEFCDMWNRRLHRIRELNQQNNLLVQKFTRSFQLLSLSHERLERRVLTNTRSLRETMTYLQEHALAAEPDSPESTELFHLLMEVLGSFGMLQVAALFRVDEYGTLIPKMVAKLGNPKMVPLGDPMLVHALKTRQLTCIRPETTLTAPLEEPNPMQISKALLAALPLVDVHGRTWGLVIIQEMPFEALSRDHLNLLAVIGGYMGDLLALASGGAGMQFHTALLRSHFEAREHKIPATLLGVVLDSSLAPPTLLGGLLEQHRGLDHQWLTRNKHGHNVLLMVVPLTDAEGARGFVQRLDAWCWERHGRSLADAGVRIHQAVLDGAGDAQDKLRTMKEACEIHAA